MGESEIAGNELQEINSSIGQMGSACVSSSAMYVPTVWIVLLLLAALERSSSLIVLLSLVLQLAGKAELLLLFKKVFQLL